MEWLDIKTTDDERKLINIDSIMSIYYTKDTDLTIIEFTRAAYAPVYVRGDITKEIRRTLNAHNHFVNRIGE